MELIKNDDVVKIIERLCYHYHLNITNRVLRPVVLQLYLDTNTWDLVEILTEKLEIYRYQGFNISDLYRQVAACARFVEAARYVLVPTLKSKLNIRPGTPDKIYREMTANNFPHNLQVFAEFVNELYVYLMDYERKKGVKTPIYEQIPELEDVSRILTGS